MRKCAISTIITEVLDMATGITDSDGRLVSSGMGIPFFVGAVGFAVRGAIQYFADRKEPIREGDIIMLNDPYSGGVTHLNDHLILYPIFHAGERVAWCGNIAHWGDIGGHVVGSQDLKATEIYAEGIVIPPTKVGVNHELLPGCIDISRANSRFKDALVGDFNAAVASVRIGRKRIEELIGNYSVELFREAVGRYFEYANDISRAGLRNPALARLAELAGEGITFSEV
jgi:N-methylhydantoinase B